MTLATETPPPTSLKLSQVVHANIRAELARVGRTRVELQRHFDEKPAWMQRRFNGEVAWSIDEIEKIAKWLNVKVETLLTRRTL